MRLSSTVQSKGLDSLHLSLDISYSSMWALDLVSDGSGSPDPRGTGFKRWGRSKGGGGSKVGDPKQQDWKTNEVDNVTILWARSAKAGLAWPRGQDRRWLTRSVEARQQWP